MTMRERREKAGMSQGQVAKVLEVDQSAISKWESGNYRPLAKYQRKLAALYGVTVEELLEDEAPAKVDG